MNKKIDGEKIKKDAEKIKNTKLAQESTSFIKSFMSFISKGNVIDLAVGVVIGSAFGKIVSSLVDDIIMPLVGVIIGGIDFSGLSANVGDAKVTYGMFIQNVIDFLIVALCIFIFIRIINKFKLKKEKEEIKEEPKKEEQVVLLEEIRDLLKQK